MMLHCCRPTVFTLGFQSPVFQLLKFSPFPPYSHSLSFFFSSFQFVDGTFDAVVDKGGLDALMEPELGPKLGSQYLSEVSWTKV